MSKNMSWELRSHVIFRDNIGIYYLKSNMCDHKETYIGSAVPDNVVDFKNIFNQHISDCRTGISTCKFPIHVYHCAMKNKCLKMPRFQLNITMNLKKQSKIKVL